MFFKTILHLIVAEKHVKQKQKHLTALKKGRNYGAIFERLLEHN